MTSSILGVAAGLVLIVGGIYACMIVASHDDDINGRW